ncbi:acetyltransferase [Azorhizobium oxalatiphilum]|uniref:Acetyltransferase n=1 Tax=Azorhizobium oxalatiphilum TaxID=980631 RepID=A0A917FLN3_9HYPH|nr:acetyltransferase [Azorhizobium oxalatiphilum]
MDAAYGIHIPRMGRLPFPMQDDYADLVAQGTVHVLEADGAVAGLVVLVREPDFMFLDNIAVAPTAQRRGFGHRLLAFAEATARAAGYEAIRLYTNEVLTENIALYDRAGYVETHRVAREGFHQVYMTKQL